MAGLQKEGVDESLSHVVAIRHNATREEMVEIYDKWSTNYDADSINIIRAVAPVSSAKFLSSHMKTLGLALDAPILDLGSGTGQVGEALHKLGHNAIDALDLSQKCLDIAREKGVYRNLIRGFMASDKSSELGVQASQYDACICIGVFTIGHVRAAGFDDFVHVLKPGGLACFTVRHDVFDDPEYGFQEKMEALSREKKWRLVEKVHEPYKKGMTAWLFVFQVLEK